ncbi:hypothetical protein K0M31_019158 [Melipona bicolor]|uniref:Uncharacterized protein n=1 Tax=Melipona bicolor TaxID=60889 RepID=A0AA40G1V2_9HYME|nr:hypothetical protein K0M31_019158 [Melipona bicolor]
MCYDLLYGADISCFRAARHCKARITTLTGSSEKLRIVIVVVDAEQRSKGTEIQNRTRVLPSEQRTIHIAVSAFPHEVVALSASRREENGAPLRRLGENSQGTPCISSRQRPSTSSASDLSKDTRNLQCIGPSLVRSLTLRFTPT